jgi:hypothetical protein
VSIVHSTDSLIIVADIHPRNFKTEASPEWDAFRLIDAGIFPQPLTSRKFGAICS